MCVQIRAGVATHHGGWLELFKAMKSETYKGNIFKVFDDLCRVVGAQGRVLTCLAIGP